jgi:putative protease
MNRHIEILAPAGSYESMRAAMNGGCDAVYIGGSSFGARAYADNLGEDDLLRAIDEAHIRNKKLYLTVNTLVKEGERTEKLYNFLYRPYLEGLDAVIVQDVGVMNFIHRNFPDLPIHASTQTTITMAQGANLLKASGVKRLVLARELSMDEIREMHEYTDLELEVFVHGALCYCYSGQCLMSSLIGGRSGNRGRCAQPCRQPYQFFSGSRELSDGKKDVLLQKDIIKENPPKQDTPWKDLLNKVLHGNYLLSTKDINTIELIPELIKAGASSFKIEGRMKSPEYSAGVSAIYRKYTDLYYELGEEGYMEYIKSSEYKSDMNDLLDLYNRGGFSQGYGKTYHGKEMLSMYRPNHSGILIGNVRKIKNGIADIILAQDVNAQDVLEIRADNNERAYEFTVAENMGKDTILRINTGNKRNIVKPGLNVYRTRNNKLLSSLNEEYISKDKRTYISGLLTAIEGERLKLRLKLELTPELKPVLKPESEHRYNYIEISVEGDRVQKALKKPMTVDELTAPIKRLGDTMFVFETLSTKIQGSVFVPVSKLNELRREAVEKLKGAMLDAYRRQPVRQSVKQSENSELPESLCDNPELGTICEEDMEREYQGIIACVSTTEQLEQVLRYREVSCVYLDLAAFGEGALPELAHSIRMAGKSCRVMLPVIIRSLLYKELKAGLPSLWKSGDIGGFIARSFEGAALLKDIKDSTGIDKEIILNHNMYIFNRDARDFWRQRGITRFTAPLELNCKELAALKIADCDLVIYGYMPVMVSAQCLYESLDVCTKSLQEADINGPDYLLDKTGRKFYVGRECRGCANIIYNGQCLSLLKYSREVKGLRPLGLRMDFTFETAEETERALKAFIDVFVHGKEQLNTIGEYTTGHFKRGVL